MAFGDFLRTAGKVAGYVNPVTAIPTYLADRNDIYSKVSDPNYDLIPGVSNPFNNQPRPGNDGISAPQVAIPNYQQFASTSGGQTLGSSTGGSTYDAQAAAAAEQAARASQARQLLEGQLGRLPGQQDIAFGNIDRQFNTRQNELQSQFGQAQNTYNQQGTQNRQGLVTDRNNINDQASQGLRGLMRMLGAYGAGGSSDRFLAGDAVTSTANQQLSGAGQTFSGNQSALDTNWSNFKTQDEQERQKLGDWRSQQRQSAESQGAQNRQDILSRLASLSQDAGSAQRYIDEIGTLGGRIDQLAAINPTYSGNTPVFQAPTLDSYNVGQTQIQGGPQSGGSTPFLSMLLGQDDERRRF